LTIDSKGNIFVSDSGNDRIVKLSKNGIFIKKIYSKEIGYTNSNFLGIDRDKFDNI